jgi:hypothetical protein
MMIHVQMLMVDGVIVGRREGTIEGTLVGRVVGPAEGTRLGLVEGLHTRVMDHHTILMVW